MAEHGDAKLTELLVTLANCRKAWSTPVHDRCKAVLRGALGARIVELTQSRLVPSRQARLSRHARVGSDRLDGGKRLTTDVDEFGDAQRRMRSPLRSGAVYSGLVHGFRASMPPRRQARFTLPGRENAGLHSGAVSRLFLAFARASAALPWLAVAAPCVCRG